MFQLDGSLEFKEEAIFQAFCKNVKDIQVEAKNVELKAKACAAPECVATLQAKN